MPTAKADGLRVQGFKGAGEKRKEETEMQTERQKQRIYKSLGVINTVDIAKR